MSNISCILYPPTLDYHYLVQRPQQLMKNFSELNIPTFYLNSPSPHNADKHGVEMLNENFYLFNQVDPAAYLHNINPVIYYTSAAQTASLGKYNPSLVVFDSVDEPSDEFEAWRPYYDNAVRSADIVLTTSDKLYELAAGINPNVYLVPNGCDYEHFANFIHGRPAEIANLPGPIIGYIGVVASWVDVDLIIRVADSYPDCSIVVVGPLYNISEVPTRGNIHWVGFKAYEELPAYAQSFDVGIIPFKASSMTEAVNPIKMWEYMATGMPIVTTNLPEASKYRDLVLVSAGADDFIYNVGRAIAENSPEKRSERMKLALENSWRVRASQIVAIIEERLALKGIAAAVPISQAVATPAAPAGQGVEVIVPASSGTYSYSLNKRGHCVIKIYSAKKISLAKQKSPFIKTPRSRGRRLRRSITRRPVQGKVSSRPLVKVQGGVAFRYDTGRTIQRCVC